MIMTKGADIIISWGEYLKIQWKNISMEKVMPITWLMVATILTMWILYLLLAVQCQG